MNNVLEYLEQSAKRFPLKTAVADKNHAYTFKELRDLAWRLASHPLLSSCEGKAVGVVADRSADAVLCFMAVVKSNRFYVPLDPDMPDKKLNMIIENAEISVILGSPESSDITGRIDGEVSYISPEDAPAEDVPTGGFSDDPGEPLYLIYTSGSTGVPKGVLKSHGAVIAFIESFNEKFAFDDSLIIGNQTPFFFDASARDIYLMLKTGSTLEILPTEYFAMPPSLINYMNEKKINFISWVPSALSVIVQLNTFKAAVPQYLRYVMFVGEVMPVKHLNKWREAVPGAVYVNLYGSTEVAGISCCYVVEGSFPDDAELPMGKPLPGCRIYLIDGGEIVTESAHAGEVYVVSPSVAICYFKDEEKTAACFPTVDFGEGLVRCFKSGDIARYDDAGNLLFASRSDLQIKHMGHRIELGEIESAARSIEDVEECACAYNEKKDRIILFCSLREGSTLTGADIKANLTSRLSSYMVPNRVNIEESLPHNANNKIDRQKLKEMV